MQGRVTSPGGSEMMFVGVEAAAAHEEAAFTAMIQEIRRAADTFVFLSGGASKMTDSTREQALGLLQALAVIAGERKLAVGDGGTKAGLMAAAGEVRRRAPRPFLLVGVAPAPEITRSDEPGKTPVEPNHTHLVCRLLLEKKKQTRYNNKKKDDS